MLESRTNVNAVMASRGLSSNREVTHQSQSLQAILLGAQEELNRLCNIARQARYEVRFCDPAGALVDFPGRKDLARDRTDEKAMTTRLPNAATKLQSVVAEHESMLVDFGSHFRIRHGGLSSAATPVFDANGELAGTLDLVALDPGELEVPAPLTRALVQATAHAIEERAFRECHRSLWIVAVTPRDPSLAPKLFAVDGQQNIIGADRHGRAMMSSDLPGARNLAKPVSLWALFERNPAPFRSRARVDVAAMLVSNGAPESWSAVITPPEVKAAMGIGSDSRLHVRPRIDAIASFPQLPVNEQARGGLPPGVLRRVRAHIDANLEANIDLSDLAAVANLSRCHFARAFKQSAGATPHDYLVQRRLERAQELLADTEMPLAEIALATGFSDQSHFSRRFRERLQSSPSAFRRARR
jgi:AraC-like DNA-binding protein